jgi:FtsP/CotA-like multicopper oxidase with cupredoxin domain
MLVSNFRVGETHHFRLINSGVQGTQQFSIGNHIITVAANDIVPVQPYNTTIVTLGTGRRTGIVVNPTGNSSGAYWMRSKITCANSNQLEALAAIYYDRADINCSMLLPLLA